MVLTLFILICYGLSNILVHGAIFDGFRVFLLTHSPNFLGKLFTCMMCLPFWVGVLVSVLVFSPTSLYLIPQALTWLIIPFIDGCIASGAVWLLHTLQEYLENDKGVD